MLGLEQEPNAESEQGDGQGGDDSEQSDDDEHEEQGVDDDDQSQSTGHNHDQIQVSEYQSEGGDDDEQSQSQADNSVEGEVGESQPGSRDGEPMSDSQKTLVRSPFLVDYMNHCEWAYARFGVRATNWLSTRDYWVAWLCRYQARGNKVLSPKDTKELTESCPDALAAAEEFKKSAKISEALSYLYLLGFSLKHPSAKGNLRQLMRKNSFDEGNVKEAYTGEIKFEPGIEFTARYLPALRLLAIEVLLKQRAFVVKRLGGEECEGDGAAKGQYTWSKHWGGFQMLGSIQESCSLAKWGLSLP
eukprot:s2953_g14.t1